MLPNLGTPEILIILFVVLLVFGAKRLPDMGAAMGKGIREFKKNLTEVKENIERGASEDDSTSPRQIDAPASSSSGDPKKLSE
jgi:sec-independent protein translocase protein TatA